MTQACQFEFHRQLERLLETAAKQRRVVFAEIAEDAKVGAVGARDEHEPQVFAAALFDLPRTENAAAVGVYQNAEDLSGGVCALTEGAVLTFRIAGVEHFEQVVKQEAIVPLGQKIKEVAGVELMLLVFDGRFFKSRCFVRCSGLARVSGGMEKLTLRGGG